MDKRITAIAEHYGYEKQSQQCIEEMAELTKAICKYQRAGKVPGTEYADLIEEVADVEIMIKQLKYLLGPADVDEMVGKKLDRQMKRMGEE